MSIGIIVQARTGSKRLPAKILLKIGNKRILEHLISRLKKIKIKNKIIIATTKNKSDTIINKIAKNNDCYSFNGTSLNVLKRYYQTAKKFKLETIVRICSDSPFMDPHIVEKAIKIFKTKKYDYVSNIIKPTYPAGMSVEVFSFDVLNKVQNSKTNKIEKEHVTPYIYRNYKKFKIKNFSIKKDYTSYKLSVDYLEDYKLAKALYTKILDKENYNYLNLIKILNSNQKIRNINSNKRSILRY
tara:strand:- start:6573 stop:7298 length:726 start_codon:yes stop_codon:yes gene_type:complete